MTNPDNLPSPHDPSPTDDRSPSPDDSSGSDSNGPHEGSLSDFTHPWDTNTVPGNPAPGFSNPADTSIDFPGADAWSVPFSDFAPPDNRFALELRAESIEQLTGGDALRRGGNERIEAGGSDGNTDLIAGCDRVQVQGTLDEHTGHGLAIQAAHLDTTVDGSSDTWAGKEDTIFLVGHMRDTWNRGSATVAALCDDLAAGGGMRSNALDLWVHGLMGLEERPGTCTADGVLAEACGTLYEREYRTAVHAAGLAVFNGALYQSVRNSFRPLMRISMGVRNLIPGGGGSAGGGAPPASPPPAGAQGAEAATETLAAGREIGESTGRAADGGINPGLTELDSLAAELRALALPAASRGGDADAAAHAEDLHQIVRSSDTAGQLGALRRGEIESIGGYSDPGYSRITPELGDQPTNERNIHLIAGDAQPTPDAVTGAGRRTGFDEGPRPATPETLTFTVGPDGRVVVDYDTYEFVRRGYGSMRVQDADGNELAHGSYTVEVDRYVVGPQGDLYSSIVSGLPHRTEFRVDESEAGSLHFAGFEPVESEISQDAGWRVQYSELRSRLEHLKSGGNWYSANEYRRAIDDIERLVADAHRTLGGDVSDLASDSLLLNKTEQMYSDVQVMEIRAAGAHDGRRIDEVRAALEEIDHHTSEHLAGLTARVDDFSGRSDEGRRYLQLDPHVDPHRLSGWIQEQIDHASTRLGEVDLQGVSESAPRASAESVLNEWKYYLEARGHVRRGHNPALHSNTKIVYLSSTGEHAQAEQLLELHMRLVAAMTDPSNHRSAATVGGASYAPAHFLRPDLRHAPLTDGHGNLLPLPDAAGRTQEAMSSGSGGAPPLSGHESLGAGAGDLSAIGLTQRRSHGSDWYPILDPGFDSDRIRSWVLEQLQASRLRLDNTNVRTDPDAVQRAENELRYLMVVDELLDQQRDPMMIGIRYMDALPESASPAQVAHIADLDLEFNSVMQGAYVPASAADPYSGTSAGGGPARHVHDVDVTRSPQLESGSATWRGAIEKWLTTGNVEFESDHPRTGEWGSDIGPPVGAGDRPGIDWTDGTSLGAEPYPAIDPGYDTDRILVWVDAKLELTRSALSNPSVHSDPEVQERGQNVWAYVLAVREELTRGRDPTNVALRHLDTLAEPGNPAEIRAQLALDIQHLRLELEGVMRDAYVPASASNPYNATSAGGGPALHAHDAGVTGTAQLDTQSTSWRSSADSSSSTESLEAVNWRGSHEQWGSTHSFEVQSTSSDADGGSADSGPMSFPGFEWWAAESNATPSRFNRSASPSSEDTGLRFAGEAGRNNTPPGSRSVQPERWQFSESPQFGRPGSPQGEDAPMSLREQIASRIEHDEPFSAEQIDVLKSYLGDPFDSHAMPISSLLWDLQQVRFTALRTGSAVADYSGLDWVALNALLRLLPAP